MKEMTNNPVRISAMEAMGITIERRVPIEPACHADISAICR